MKSFRLFSRSTSNIILCFVLYFFVISTADACLGRFNIPDPGKPELYDSIFMAKVESFKFVPSIFGRSDLTPPYEITLSEPSEILYGEEQLSTVIHIMSGCGIPMPQAGKVGIFFVHPGSQKRIEPILYDDGNGYRLVRTVEKIMKAVNALNESLPSNQN